METFFLVSLLPAVGTFLSWSEGREPLATPVSLACGQVGWVSYPFLPEEVNLASRGDRGG